MPTIHSMYVSVIIILNKWRIVHMYNNLHAHTYPLHTHINTHTSYTRNMWTYVSCCWPCRRYTKHTDKQIITDKHSRPLMCDVANTKIQTMNERVCTWRSGANTNSFSSWLSIAGSNIDFTIIASNGHSHCFCWGKPPLHSYIHDKCAIHMLYSPLFVYLFHRNRECITHEYKHERYCGGSLYISACLFTRKVIYNNK